MGTKVSKPLCPSSSPCLRSGSPDVYTDSTSSQAALVAIFTLGGSLGRSYPRSRLLAQSFHSAWQVFTRPHFMQRLQLEEEVVLTAAEEAAGIVRAAPPLPPILSDMPDPPRWPPAVPCVCPGCHHPANDHDSSCPVACCHPTDLETSQS